MKFLGEIAALATSFLLCHDSADIYRDRAHGGFAGNESHAPHVCAALSHHSQSHSLSRAIAFFRRIFTLALAESFRDHRPVTGRCVPFSSPSSRVGPRLGSLLLSLAPIFGSLIAWVFFGEILTVLQITGIVLALAGIAWVVASHEEPPDTPHGHTRRGVIFGVLAGLGQAVGLVLSKQGMFGDFSPFQANAIRMLAAVIFIWVWTVFDGKAGATFTALRGKPRVIRLARPRCIGRTCTGRICLACWRSSTPKSVWRAHLWPCRL